MRQLALALSLLALPALTSLGCSSSPSDLEDTDSALNYGVPPRESIS